MALIYPTRREASVPVRTSKAVTHTLRQIAKYERQHGRAQSTFALSGSDSRFIERHGTYAQFLSELNGALAPRSLTAAASALLVGDPEGGDRLAVSVTQR